MVIDVDLRFSTACRKATLIVAEYSSPMSSLVDCFFSLSDRSISCTSSSSSSRCTGALRCRGVVAMDTYKPRPQVHKLNPFLTILLCHSRNKTTHAKIIRFSAPAQQVSSLWAAIHLLASFGLLWTNGVHVYRCEKARGKESNADRGGDA